MRSYTQYIDGEDVNSPPPASPTNCWLENFVMRTFADVSLVGPAYIAILPR